MGFNCEFFTYPKYKNNTYLGSKNIRLYFDYQDSEWAKKNYSLEEYLNSNEVEMPLQDEIDYYKDKLIIDEFGHKTLINTLDWWCSNGIPIYKIIEKVYPNLSKDEYVEINSKEEIINLLNIFWKEYIDNVNPIECYCYHSFKSKYNEEDDEEEITLKSCDGIELTYGDNNEKVKRVYCGDIEWTSPLITIENDSIDELYITSIRNVISILINALSIDFNNTILIFSGGW